MRTPLLLLVLSTLALAEEPVAVPTLDAAAIVAGLDEQWKTRDDAASIAASNELIRAGNRVAATDYAFLWRAARFRWWEADGLDTGDRKKRMIAKEGWNYANRAMAANANGPEGRYYVALSIGAYSQAVGILKALTEGLEGQFVEHLDFAMAHNESFDRHGAHTAKGRYHWELPWPKRDLKKSREELAKSMATNPEHLRNSLFLAETLLKDGDPRGAKVEIDKVLNGDASYDPPEARRVKRWARPVAEAIAEQLK